MFSRPPTSPERSLVRRIVFAAALSVGIVMLAAGLAAALLLRAHIERGFDARLREDAMRLMTGLSREGDGTLAISNLPDSMRYEERLSGWYWLIRDQATVVARSRSLGAHELARDASGNIDVDLGSRRERLRAITLHTRSQSAKMDHSVTVAGPQSEIDSLVLEDMLPLIAGLATLALALIGVLRWQVKRALAPLDALVEDIERLKDGRLRALPPSSYAELSRLTTTINGLLAHSRDLLALYRDRAAKLAHALKTPLALIAARAGNHGQNPDAKVLEAVEAMRRQIDHNLKRARAASRSSAFAARVPVAEVVGELMLALGHLYASRRLSQSVAVPNDLVFVGDREDLQEMLGNLIENAFQWARATVAVSAGRQSGVLQIVIEDDGPGLPDLEQKDEGAVVDRTSAASLPPGSDRGLGLQITRDIAANYGGTLSFARASASGLRAVIAIPDGVPQETRISP